MTITKLITPETKHRAVNKSQPQEPLQQARQARQTPDFRIQPPQQKASNQFNHQQAQQTPPQQQPTGSSFSFKKFVGRLLLLIVLVISLLALYLAWSGDNSKWQVESINGLQTSISQINTKFSGDIADIKASNDEGVSEQKETFDNIMEQISAIKIAQEKIRAQNLSLQKTISNQKNTLADSILSLATISNLQVQKWALKINNQWLFEGEQIATYNSLKALLQTISLSSLPYKQQLIKTIKQDQRMVDNFRMPLLKLDEIKELKSWLTKLALVSKPKLKPKAIPEEAKPLTNWEKIKLKYSALFNIRKRDSKNSITVVQAELEKEIVKQRMLLQADQLGWALNTNSPQVVQYALIDISNLIKQYAPESLNKWQMRMINLIPSSQMVKPPLAITELSYASNP